MKYPSADSLNQVAGGNFSYEQIVGMETSLLVEIDWELLQYPVFEYISLFLC